jgi:hypothetical protein
MVSGLPPAAPSVLTRLFRGGPEQLRLPMEVPGEARMKFFRAAKDFATGFAPKLGSKLLMRFGIPMVAATTPVAIRLLNPEWEDEIVPNLLVGSALGGAWGAAVGAMLPFTEAGVKVSRLRSAGTGAAGGILLAPAVALASKYVADWLTSPLEKARDRAEDRADQAEHELEQTKTPAAPTPTHAPGG